MLHLVETGDTTDRAMFDLVDQLADAGAQAWVEGATPEGGVELIVADAGLVAIRATATRLGVPILRTVELPTIGPPPATAVAAGG